MIVSDEKKMEDLLSFSKKLRYTQRIIFSNEGNINSISDIFDTPQQSDDKPTGLWYSFGKAWLDLLMFNPSWGQPRMKEIRQIYRIQINDSVLRIHTKNEFEQFQNRYTCGTYSCGSCFKIEWNKVAKKYNGIEILYRKEKSIQRKSYWYMSWDCSSGCIWNKDAVKKIETIKKWVPYWELNEIS